MHLRGKAEAFTRMSDTESGDDTEMEEAPAEVAAETAAEPAEDVDGASLIIAIDFGTTFSSVAFRVTDNKDRQGILYGDNIDCVGKFPKDPAGSEGRKEVPSESWYRGKPYDDNDEDLSDGSNEMNSSSGQIDSVDTEGLTKTIWDPWSNENDDEEVRVDMDRYVWGYGVQHNLKTPIHDFDRKFKIARSKLLLGGSAATPGDREKLNASTKALRRKGYIKKDYDVITDFLTSLMQHTKAHLSRYGYFQESVPLEFVICVPAAWTPSACRTMQTAMAQAVKRAALGELSSEGIQNVFIVSEAEAAAACVLTGSRDIKVNSLISNLSHI
jgi:hypothetical protein